MEYGFTPKDDGTYVLTIILSEADLVSAGLAPANLSPPDAPSTPPQPASAEPTSEPGQGEGAGEQLPTGAG